MQEWWGVNAAIRDTALHVSGLGARGGPWAAW
jgi:hypothetical protein